MDQSEQSEDNPLVQSEMMNSHDVQLTGDISQSDQSEEGTLGSQSQLIGTDAVLTQQVRICSGFFSFSGRVFGRN